LRRNDGSLPGRERSPIIAGVARRIHVHQLRPGEPITLDRAEAHHARHVLRLSDGARVEVFDDAGTSGEGVLMLNGPEVCVRVDRAQPPVAKAAIMLRVIAAVPKGERAEWMVEKLSELGVDEYVPLAAARSVVLPEGRGKRERWARLATEAAKQSRRSGVMKITELTDLSAAIACTRGSERDSLLWFLTTEEEDAMPIAVAREALPADVRLSAFVGPEGGWTEKERAEFKAAGATAVRLGPTILRVETAAVVVAALVTCAAPRTRAGGA
jgi:16S rRNA (uracil1498-N3)-methyltransferase